MFGVTGLDTQWMRLCSVSDMFSYCVAEKSELLPHLHFFTHQGVAYYFEYSQSYLIMNQQLLVVKFCKN